MNMAVHLSFMMHLVGIMSLSSTQSLVWRFGFGLFMMLDIAIHFLGAAATRRNPREMPWSSFVSAVCLGPLEPNPEASTHQRVVHV